MSIIQLKDYQGKPEEIRKLSKELNTGNHQLDCSGISSLTSKELNALFSQIRPEWMTYQELNKFINMDTLEDGFKMQIQNYIQYWRAPKPPISPWLKVTGLGIIIAGIGILVLWGLKINHDSKRRIEKNSLTIDTIWKTVTNSSQINLLEGHLNQK